MTTAGLCVNDIFPSFWRHQRRLMADIMMLEHDGYIPCVSSWARRGAEMDWIHLPQPVPAARASSKLADLFVPVLLECELAKIEIACKRVSYRLFKTGLYLLGRNSYFRDLPVEILRHIHDMGNAQPTAAAHFEREIYTVASDVREEEGGGVPRRGIIDTVDAVAFSHLARALDPGVSPE